MKIEKSLLNKFANSEKNTFNKFTEIVAVSSIILGTVALILSLSILEGFDTKLRDFSMRFAAHINVNTINNSIFDFESDKIKNLKNILPDSSIIIQGLSSESVVKGNNQILSISIRAINHKSYDYIKDFILDNQFELENLSDNGIIISKTLSDKLNLKVNDDLIVFSPIIQNASLSDFKVSKFKIKSIYHSGMTQYDEVLAFSSYNSVANLLNKRTSEANSIQIYLKNPYIAPTLINSIERQLDYPFYAYTIFDMNQQIFSWIELQKEPIPIILGSISLIAALNIITTLLVMILDKVKSIGILRTIGITKMSLLKLLLVKGFRISLLGAFLGTSISLILLLSQHYFEIIKLDGSIYYIDSLPIAFNWSYFVIVNIFTILLGTIVSLLPAYVSVKIDIIKAIKFN